MSLARDPAEKPGLTRETTRRHVRFPSEALPMFTWPASPSTTVSADITPVSVPRKPCHLPSLHVARERSLCPRHLRRSQKVHLHRPTSSSGRECQTHISRARDGRAHQVTRAGSTDLFVYPLRRGVDSAMRKSTARPFSLAIQRRMRVTACSDYPRR